jgi:hypothetical protein
VAPSVTPSANVIVVEPNAIDRERSAVYAALPSPGARSVRNRRSSASACESNDASANSGFAFGPVYVAGVGINA